MLEEQTIEIVVQARMNSTRLPGKMRLPFYRDKTILQVVVEELLGRFAAERIVVATTLSADDNVLCDLATSLGVRSYRGHEDDVLQRALDATSNTEPDFVVRVCADNPFLRSSYIADLLTAAEPSDDYVSFATTAGVPSIRTHFGLFAEVIRRTTLCAIADESAQPVYREHMTSFVLDHVGNYNCRFLPIPESVEKVDGLRLTVDTMDDFEICQALYSKVVEREGAQFGADDLVEAIHQLPPAERERMASQLAANQK